MRTRISILVEPDILGDFGWRWNVERWRDGTPGRWVSTATGWRQGPLRAVRSARRAERAIREHVRLGFKLEERP